MLKQKIGVSQKQVLIPQLHQSLKILQLSNMDLIEEIKSEIIENPFLEEAEKSNIEREKDLKEEINFEESRQDIVDTSEIYSALKNPETTIQNYRGMEWIASKEATIYDYLLHQLQLISLSEKEYFIGKLLIEKINTDGYLDCCLKCIAEIVKDDVKIVEKVLQKIQKFEPPGIAARNLKETLLIQAEYLEILDSNLKQIIEKYLLNIQKNEYKKIAQDLNISQEEVLDYINQIKTLEPKPARLYGNIPILYVLPDVVIRKHEDQYVIELCNDWLPTLRISSYYTNLLKNRNIQKDIRAYLIERLRKAKWFMKCIDQRQQTILVITNVVFKHQRDFLDYGPDKLKTLRMEDIANSLGIHLSTVSRAISNKYIQTPIGLFSFKYFFAVGKEGISGKNVSRVSIKEKLKQIINEEEKKSPLIDEEIVDEFKRQGFQIARRTIAKYRNELCILPSNLRKEK
ncbi:MAG: RNA polymerase factor sigma-54 [bacterium]|nr:RNA polymerase factor sigma-54 [bacterium]